MARKPAPAEVPESFWGLPLDWDGHEKRQYPFFVSSVADIDDDGWAYMFKSTQTAWVIIPNRSQNADNNVR